MGNDSDGDIRIFGREQNPSEDNSFIEEMQRQLDAWRVAQGYDK